MFQCSVILSMKLTFLQLLHVARWLLHFQTHGVIQGRKRKTTCHSGRACVALAKAKLSGNPQQHSASVLLLRAVMKSTVAARQSGEMSILAGLTVTLKNLGFY